MCKGNGCQTRARVELLLIQGKFEKIQTFWEHMTAVLLSTLILPCMAGARTEGGTRSECEGRVTPFPCAALTLASMPDFPYPPSSASHAGWCESREEPIRAGVRTREIEFLLILACCLGFKQTATCHFTAMTKLSELMIPISFVEKKG